MGLLADIGGGSLELVRVDNGTKGAALTLPLGVIRLVGTIRRRSVQRASDRRGRVSLDRLA